MNINLNPFATLLPGGDLLSEVPQSISNAIQSLEGGSSHAERCEKFFGAVNDRIQQLQQGGTLTPQDVAGFKQAIAYGDTRPMPGIDLSKLDLKVGKNPFLRGRDDDDCGRVRDHRAGDDGYRCGGNDPDRLKDDRERLGKDERRLHHDYTRCKDDLNRLSHDLENGNWKALADDMKRFGQDLQHYGHDSQRYDRDLERYVRDLRSEGRIRPLNEDPLQDAIQMLSRSDLR